MSVTLRFIPICVLILSTFMIGHRGLAQSISESEKSQILEKAGFGSEEITQMEALSDHVSRTSGVHHYYLQQTRDGIPVYGTVTSVHLLPNGELFKVNNRFIDKLQTNASRHSIEADKAIERAAAFLGNPVRANLARIAYENTPDQKSSYTDGGISNAPITAELNYVLGAKNTATLAWSIFIDNNANDFMWNIFIDALNGEELKRVPWTVACFNEAECTGHSHDNHAAPSKTEATHALSMTTGASYNVYPMPVESPGHGDRSILTEPHDTTASPFGWHDTDGEPGEESTFTEGNNTNAYEDGNNSGFQPDGGSSLTFDFPIDTNYSVGNESEPAIITNLFYWNNVCHDLWYHYGFDEASGNFREDNYGNGGIGGDRVNAEAQDGSGTCNANMSTPPDGSNGRMQMYVCGDRDGDIDNLVIVHEFGHGISIRLTGGAATSGCLGNDEQMGEGWSDWFGLMMTIESGDLGPDARGIGTWLFGEGPNGPGIRPYPYSTDLGVNPQTYDDIKSLSIPHGVGSVWSTMLWEMTWALIDVYGFDPDFYRGTGGNNMAMALVIEALKLQPCSPGFVDGRDAILAADSVLYNGANHCLIWEAFAKRGLGYSANQGSSFNRGDGTEAFDLPPTCLAPSVYFAQGYFERYEFNSQATPPDSNGCRPYFDYQLEVSLALDADDSTNVKIKVDSSTALNGVDFALIDSLLVFDEAADKIIRLRIFDDAAVEGDETIYLGMEILNPDSSNAILGSDSSMAFKILDDDLPPGTPYSTFILNADFEVSDFGFTSQNSGGDDWKRGTASDASSQFWQVPPNGSDMIFYANDDVCNCDMSDVRLISPIIDLSGINNPRLTYNRFFEGGSFNGVTESAALLISTDGGASYTPVLEFEGLENAWRTDTFDLSPYASETDLRVAFLYSDNGDWLFGFALDDIRIFGTVTPQVTVATDTMAIDNQYVGPYQDVYFYDDTERLIARLQNGSDDLGCVELFIDRNGYSTNMLWDDTTQHRVLSKTYYLQPQYQSDTTEYTITLYFDGDEVISWENETGKAWENDAKIIKHPLSINKITPAEQEPAGIGTVEQKVDQAGLNGFNENTWFIKAFFDSGFSGMGVGDPGPVPPYCPDQYIVPYVPTVDGTYEAQMQLSADGKVPNNGNVLFTAGQEVLLLPNFEVEAGAVFEISMEECN